MQTAFALALAIGVAVMAGGAARADMNGYKVVDGLTVYYSVIPVEMLRAYPKGSAEARTHAHIPRGKNAHHLLVALFEGKGMERVVNADVTSRVREIGLGWTRKRLEPTTIAEALAYCGYFDFYRHTTYKIEIEVRRPGTSEVITAEFEFNRDR